MSIGEQGGDDHEAVRLITLAVGLDLGAVAKVLVHETSADMAEHCRALWPEAAAAANAEVSVSPAPSGWRRSGGHLDAIVSQVDDPTLPGTLAAGCP